MKALKVLARIFFTVLFIVLIACIIVILTYTLNQPDRTGVSRQIITGPWIEVGDGEMTFTFDQEGNFTVTDGSSTIADGYFKLDTDSQKIKLFMIPGHYTNAFSKYVKYKVLAEISYDNLEFPELDDDEIDPDNPPTVTFLIRANDGTESGIYDCKMVESTIDLYNSEHDLTKDA
jgi:hypothetical protein